MISINSWRRSTCWVFPKTDHRNDFRLSHGDNWITKNHTGMGARFTGWWEREVGLWVANINTLSGESKRASSGKMNRFSSFFQPSTSYFDLLTVPDSPFLRERMHCSDSKGIHKYVSFRVLKEFLKRKFVSWGFKYLPCLLKTNWWESLMQISLNTLIFN